MELFVFDSSGRLKTAGTGGGGGGGDALTTDPLSQFAATTSLQLKGVISDETGSGALVFATSPTLVTPLLGTPTSGTLTNCTGLPTAGIVDDAVTYAKIQNVSATDKVLGRSTAGAGDVEEIDCTAAGRALIDDADASAQRTTLGLVIGTNVQAYDAELAALAGLTSAADKGIQFTGAGTAGTYDLTAAGKALLDDADASAQRTTLGVGTADSPQFTGLELGHASDTTLTRSSAGNVAIEGNVIYRAGGTDVPVADGGTGASDAATAFSNLKQAATDTATGVVELATTAEAIAGTDTTRAVTPEGLLAAINALASGLSQGKAYALARGAAMP